MKSNIPRKTPSQREPKKSSKSIDFQVGRTVEFYLGKTRISALVIGMTSDGKRIKVRLRQQHPRQINRTESQELSKITTRLNQIKQNYGFRTSTQEEDREFQALEQRVNSLIKIKPLTKTRTFTISPKDVIQRQEKVNKPQRVTETEKRKLRRQQLLQKINSLLRTTNPKRLQRYLRETDLNGMTIDQVKAKAGTANRVRQKQRFLKRR